MWRVYLLEAVIVFTISIIWVYGIDKIAREHPDYKGEDFLDWKDEDEITK